VGCPGRRLRRLRVHPLPKRRLGARLAPRESCALDAARHRSARVPGVEERPPGYLRRHGAVAIPVEQWERWRESIAPLPAAAGFQRARRDDLRRAWGRPERFELLAAETDSTEDAAARLRAVADWLADGDAPAEGELVRGAAVGARVEIVYIDVPDTFDRPELEEWRAYALVDGRLAPAFGDWTLDPAPIPRSAGL